MAIVFSLHLKKTVTRVERLSIESLIQAKTGQYILYSYRKNLNNLPVIPHPASYADANTIIPMDEFTRGSDGTYTLAKAEFQFEALRQHGGTWINTDYVLIDKLPKHEYLAVQNDDDKNNIALMPELLRVPKDSIFAQDALQYIRRMKKRGKAISQSQLYREISKFWPGDMTLLSSTKTFTTKPKTAAYTLLDPYYFPELEGHRGVLLRPERWTDYELTADSSFSMDSLFERLWSKFYGSRKDALVRPIFEDPETIL